MRTFFFGDIHGNSDALEACLDKMDELRADRAYCLGDIVGWLPFGDRTLARMRELAFPSVVGNHDLLVAGAFTDRPDQVDRMQATAYNAGLLSKTPGAREYLLGLPLEIEEEEFVIVHHSPFHLPGPGEAPNIRNFDYLDETALTGALPAWGTFPKRLIVSGHDHIPAVHELPLGAGRPPVASDLRVHRPAEQSLTIRMKDHCLYWVKAGSVGGPYRDSSPLANAFFLDDAEATLTLLRIPYPHARLREELSANTFCLNIPTIRKFINLLR